jgi:site-specific recombinase XerD
LAIKRYTAAKEADMTPRTKNVLPMTKSPQEWGLLFDSIDKRYPTQARNYALLYLMYVTGLRVGEALALRVKDVDFDLGKVTVVAGKTGQRVVPLPDYATELKHSMARWLAFRESWNPKSDLLFVTARGRPIHDSEVRRAIARYGERSGIGHVTPHMLRHSAATEMLAAGAPPIGVQRVLGHKSLRTTLETYAHACDTHALEAMNMRAGRSDGNHHGA